MPATSHCACGWRTITNSVDSKSFLLIHRTLR
jgi:hypothetical protein